MTILVLMAVSASAFLQVIARRLANDRTRYMLATENARSAHIISELARRSSRVMVYANIDAARTEAAPVARGDVMSFDLSLGGRRWVAWQNNQIELFTDLSAPPAVLAGGQLGRLVTRIGTDVYCDYAQGLPRAAWLARATTPKGVTEEITYSAFAVPLQGR